MATTSKIESRTAGPARTLVSALLPATWRERDAALQAAEHVDLEHGVDALDVVLLAWADWRSTGALPTNRWVCALVVVIAAFLTGGIVEPRLTPREVSG